MDVRPRQTRAGIGVAEGTPGATIEDLIRRADAAMDADKARRGARC